MGAEYGVVLCGDGANQCQPGTGKLAPLAMACAAGDESCMWSESELVHPSPGKDRKCDPFGTPSTSHWTGAAIIVQSPRTKTCIVTRPRTSRTPMPSSLAGSLTK